MRTKPCRVCGNKTRGQLSRHHLLPKADREQGTRQITIKLCRDQEGCKSHHRFHMGDGKAARSIRKVLYHWEVEWMIEQIGEEWVQTIYPYTKPKN